MSACTWSSRPRAGRVRVIAHMGCDLGGAGRRPVGLSSAGVAIFAKLAGFFSLMAVVTFGGAYAVLAYVADAAVAALPLARCRARCSTASPWPRPHPGR